MEEELTKENKNRFVLFPIKYDDIWMMYKKAMSLFWTAEEIQLSDDMSDWNKLNDNEKYFIKNVLAFFAASDGIVLENLSKRFLEEISIASIFPLFLELSLINFSSILSKK